MTRTAVPAFASLLARMHSRDGVDTLAGHLERTHGVTVGKLSELDVGVFRVDRSDGGAPLVARLFPRARPQAAVESDLAVLRRLAEIGFPAERPFAEVPLSSHEGQALLVTEFVRQVPKARRPRYPIVRLGAMIGRLNAIPVPAGADRPAGALHHFAEGTMADELRAAGAWIDSIAGNAPAQSAEALATLREALARADGGEGLPEAFVHPDPVPKNVIFTAEGPVLVDWTSAGRGPRLASMTLVLQSSWAAGPFMKGYARVVSLTADERARLPELLFSRRLIDLVFRVCLDPKSAAGRAAKLPALRRESEARARALL